SLERAERAKIAAVEKAEMRERLNALERCRKSIKSTAEYGEPYIPGNAQVRTPHAENVWQFIWPQGSFHFKNAFGVEVPQWARCEVDIPTGRISRLIVTGREVSVR